MTDAQLARMEVEDALDACVGLLSQVLRDGGGKLTRGTKTPWRQEDVSVHRAALGRHYTAWRCGHKEDPDSKAHPLVHVAARALFIAWKETHQP